MASDEGSSSPWTVFAAVALESHTQTNRRADACVDTPAHSLKATASQINRLQPAQVGRVCRRPCMDRFASLVPQNTVTPTSKSCCPLPCRFLVSSKQGSESMLSHWENEDVPGKEVKVITGMRVGRKTGLGQACDCQLTRSLLRKTRRVLLTNQDT